MPRLEGVYHPVFGLKDNRLLAHLIRQQGLLIPAGHPGVAKYLSFSRPWRTWQIRRQEDGRSVALADRPVSWLTFPLTEEQAQAQAPWLVLRLKSSKAQGLRMTLNKTTLEGAKLEQGWQTVKVPLKGAEAGENKLSLNWGGMGRIGGVKAAAAVEWVYIGPRKPESISRVAPTADGELVLPRDGGLVWYIHPYPGTKLRVAFKAQAAEARCALKVRLLARGVEPVEVVREETGLPAGQVTETFVELDPVQQSVARMELWATGKGCKELALTEAALVRKGPAPQLKRAKPPKNVIFWLIDNVRADRFTLYNPDTRVKTPVIEKLGQSGTVYTRAYIQGIESRVSHASIWTGLYPKQHRFIAPKAKLNLRWITLPEAVQKAGLFTAAWIANGFVSKFWGFGEGWNYFRNTLHQGGGLEAKPLADHTIKFIKEQGEKPFYAYVGTIDPHVSWRGKQPWLDEYHPEPYHGIYKKNVWGKDVGKMASGKRKTSPADRKRITAIYDSTVSYNDHHLGRVLKALEEKGIREQTMIVITADHGEEIWDFGRIGHGHSLRNALVAVPLVVHYPPLFGSGVRVEQGVDVLSVMPTILDALGAPIPDHVQGESLLPLAQGIGSGYPRPSIASQYELAHTIQLERWKLWVGGKGVPKLYDLESSEKEHKEIAEVRPQATRWLTDALSTFLIYQESWRNSQWGVASNHRATMPDELESGKPLEPIKP
jgi:arylsulfatase A-like enzyme